jgi:hypothetical protein
MNEIITGTEPPPVGPDDPPIDFSRELAAYERERDRLVREHLGWIALVHGNEVVGAFRTADEAILEAFRRFGTHQVMLKEIRDPDLPDFVPLADTEHPGFRKVS